MLMDGPSIAQETEHGRVVTAQLTRRHNTLGDAIDAGILALGAAGLTKGIRRQARAACEDYFYSRLGLSEDQELQPLTEIKPGLEQLPDGMKKALEDLVDLVVEGDYDELRELSDERLEVEDMRRRLEDDCPEDLITPPGEIYRIEAITKSDDPEDPGWAYFLELWTSAGQPAVLHLEGEIVETDGRYAATLLDILP